MGGIRMPEEAYDVAASVVDPELPVLTIAELGILRGVRVEAGAVEVDITPTYSGCPALEAIQADVKAALRTAGAREVHVRTVLSPAWTTDLITPAGRRKLADHGIAPPHPRRDTPDGSPVLVELSVRCPRCGSPDTGEVSRFGPTPCMALRSCRSCREPFEHMKAL